MYFNLDKISKYSAFNNFLYRQKIAVPPPVMKNRDYFVFEDIYFNYNNSVQTWDIPRNFITDTDNGLCPALTIFGTAARALVPAIAMAVLVTVGARLSSMPGF